MKKITIILLSILTITSCSFSKTGENVTKTVEFSIDQNYLLIPMQDNAPELKVEVFDQSDLSAGIYFMRIARDSVDYWVKMNVKSLEGQNIKLTFEGREISDLGINQIKQSDSFQFDFHEKYRPRIHFTPEIGWMNDPNGMVYLDGEYHLFYQYNPYGTRWGNMHWGHAVSNDLLSWSYLEPAIAPDSLGAIFSGSTVIDKNNTAGFGANAMVAIYTSAGKTQAQSIAYSTDKGRTFKKYRGNPVIPNPGIPDFRDPKVFWHNESQQWVMSLATKQTITFYASKNLKDWQKLSEFGREIGSHAGVWECPDLFPLNYEGKTKWVLLVSINPGGPNGGSATQYFIGDFDGKHFTPEALPYPLWIDYGRDNYAGVTWSNIPEADGRKIFLGWMSNWDYANDVPTKMFRSAMTTPRELAIRNNGKHMVLAGYPVNELNNIKDKPLVLTDMVGNQSASFDPLIAGNDGTYSIEMTLNRGNAEVFGFELLNKNNEKIRYKFDLKTGFLSFNRSESGLTGFNDKFKTGANAPLLSGKEYKILMLVDKYSAELFINQGTLVMTNLFFASDVYNQVRFFSEQPGLKISNIQINKIK